MALRKTSRLAVASAIVMLVIACQGSAWAVDLAKVSRGLGKQPSYQEDPRYCLLVIGREAGLRVWLVRDGAVLYVDRNLDGDLTDPTERVLPTRDNTDPTPFEKVTIVDPETEAQYTIDCHLWGYRTRRLRPNSDSPVNESIGVRMPDGRYFGAWGDQDSPLVFSSRPQDAPVVHVGGPLEMGFEVRASSALKREGPQVFELNAAVGTKGLGTGAFAWLSYNKIPEGLSPKVRLEFPGTTAGGPPVVVEAVLDQRC